MIVTSKEYCPMNFEIAVKESLVTCWNKHEYLHIRRMLVEYGIDKFKSEIELRDNHLSLIVSGKHPNKCTDAIRSDKFVLIQPPSDTIGDRHKLLCPSDRYNQCPTASDDWTIFNVLTLGMTSSTSAKLLLDDMERVAMQYTVDYGWSKNIALYFHCYPFNSINTLHLHIVDLDYINPQFYAKSTINLSLKSVRSALCTV
jgi:hypothetical protein